MRWTEQGKENAESCYVYFFYFYFSYSFQVKKRKFSVVFMNEEELRRQVLLFTPNVDPSTSRSCVNTP